MYGKWKTWRQVIVAAGFIPGLMLLVWGGPIGPLFVVGLFVAVKFWEPEMSFRLDSNQAKAAGWLTGLASGWMNYSNPYILGFGKSGQDDVYGQDPEAKSFMPPLRVSSWLSAIAVVPLGIALEYGVHRAGLRRLIPWYGEALVTVLCLFYIAQLLWAHQKTLAMSKMQLPVRVDPPPDTMFDRQFVMGNIKAAGMKALPIVAGVAVLCGLSYALLKLPLVLCLVFTGISGLIGFIYAMGRLMQAETRKDWEADVFDRLHLDGMFEALGFTKEKPIHAAKVILPDEENPEIRIDQFDLPESLRPSQFFPFSQQAGEILDCPLAAFTAPPLLREGPMGNMEEIPGTQSRILRLTRLMRDDMGLNPIVYKEDKEKPLQDLTRRHLIEAAFQPIFQVLRLSDVIFVEFQKITADDSPQTIWEVIYRVGPSANIDKYLASAPSILSSLGVQWLRAGVRPTGDPEKARYMSIMYGDTPTDDTIYPARTKEETLAFITQLELAAALAAIKMMGQDGAMPVVRKLEALEHGVNKFEVDLPTNMSVEMLQAVTGPGGSLLTASQAGLIDVFGNKLIPDKATFVWANRSPFIRTFEFKEYFDKLLKGREPGKAKLTWYPGVFSDGTMASYTFNKGIPHLIVAGATGQGKSVIANIMLLTLMWENGPGELEWYLTDPKGVELNQFTEVDSVRGATLFTMEEDGDHDTDDEYEFVRATCVMGNHLKKEMNRRATVFGRWEKKLGLTIKNITSARAAYVRFKGKEPNIEELQMPYCIWLIDETADLLDAMDSNRKALMEDLGNAGDFRKTWFSLIQKARAAGIYLVMATQRPTVDAIPGRVKANARRLGLGVQSAMDSRIIIDRPGLEGLVGQEMVGQFMISISATMYRHGKGLFVREMDDDGTGQDDRVDVLSRLPKNTVLRTFREDENMVIKLPDSIWNVDDDQFRLTDAQLDELLKVDVADINMDQVEGYFTRDVAQATGREDQYQASFKGKDADYDDVGDLAIEENSQASSELDDESDDDDDGDLFN